MERGPGRDEPRDQYHRGGSSLVLHKMFTTELKRNQSTLRDIPRARLYVYRSSRASFATRDNVARGVKARCICDNSSDDGEAQRVAVARTDETASLLRIDANR